MTDRLFLCCHNVWGTTEDERERKRHKRHKKDKKKKKEKKERKRKRKDKDKDRSSSHDERRKALEEQAKAFLQKNASAGEKTAILANSDYFSRNPEFSLWWVNEMAWLQV